MSDSVLFIGELSRRAGVTTDVIRAWERRYGLLEPQRTDGGFRLYSADDVSRLRLMQHFLATGIPTAKAAELVRRAEAEAHQTNPGIPRADVRRALHVLRTSLESFDDGPADRMLQRLLGVFAPGAVLRDVVLPYLEQLGTRWERAETTIAQEHFASSFLQGWMMNLARGWGRGDGRRAVLACVPGEFHVLGLIAFGLALRDLGWRVTYLGADTPVASVELAAETVAADVIVLAATLPTTLAASAEALEPLVAARAVRLGGSGVSGNTAPWVAERALPRDPLVAAQLLAS